MKTRWNTLYVKYIITGSELYGDGYRTSDGEVFVKDDTVIKLDDRMWNEYEAKTKDNDVKYSIVEDNVEIADEDYFLEYFTNKDKWAALISKEDLVWQKWW